MSFLMCEAKRRLKNNALVNLINIIHWQSVGEKMGKLGRSGYGPKAYNSVGMLKALILQAWHNLSDTALEEALRVRIDFMVITNFHEIPDATTICRFRNLLIEQGLFQPLLNEINAQLQAHGLKVQKSQGAILDATVIESAAKPDKVIETMAVDRMEEETEHYEVNEINQSSDPDATWLKKGNKSYFGFKAFVVTDAEDGYIETVHVTPANVSEMKEFANIVPQIQGKRRVFTDKGSASTANRQLLKDYGHKNGIMEKAQRNRPLRETQKLFNRKISKVRYKVEQAFGTLKRRFGFRQASYLGTVKVQAQMILKSIAFNIKKAFNKINRLYLTPALPL